MKVTKLIISRSNLTYFMLNMEELGFSAFRADKDGVEFSDILGERHFAFYGQVVIVSKLKGHPPTIAIRNTYNVDFD